MRILGKVGKASALVTALTLFGGVASATSHSLDIAEILSQTFLPESAAITGPQGVIFGVFLPLIIFWVIVYAGLQKASVFDRRVNTVLSIAISLFLIPSGAYRIISGFLFWLFGLGLETFTVPGISGVSSDIPFLGSLDPVMSAFLIATGVAASLLLLLMNVGRPEVSLTEDILILLAWIGTFLAFGGFNALMGLLGWLLLLAVGFGLIEVYRKVGGGIGAIFGVLGLVVIGWAVRAQSMFPDPIRMFGQWVLTGVHFGLVGATMVISISIWGYLTAKPGIQPNEAKGAAIGFLIVTLVMIFWIFPPAI